AFFALRSCHSIFREDRGEFFSPDHLCSNPPLWCNWTIWLDAGKRVVLHLLDLTPAYSCEFKTDEIHLEESPARGRHRVLDTCWQEARHISQANILHVVLLIRGNRRWPYRGFYGQYHVLEEALTAEDAVLPSVPASPRESPVEEQFVSATDGEEPRILSATQTTPVETLSLTDMLDSTSDWAWNSLKNKSFAESLQKSQLTQLKWASSEETESIPSSNPWYTTPVSLNDASPDSKDQERLNVPEFTPPLEFDHETSLYGQTFDRKSQTEEMSKEFWEEISGHTPTKVYNRATSPQAENTSVSRHHRNVTRISHFPGEYLYEVSVEVQLSRRGSGNQEQLVKTLLSSLQRMIKEEFRPFRPHLKSVSSKRVKSLNAGFLFILWLQFGFGEENISMLLKSFLERLVDRPVAGLGPGSARVISVSAEDVNECRTELVLCDIHADCFNVFGTYACRCQRGFEDFSRIGSGGTLCIDPATSYVTDAHSNFSPTLLKTIYGMGLLFTVLLLLLLGIVAVLYRRHHKGAFVVQCQRSS
uniref:CUB domain-containing protein n=1 Tax=Lepisosteus oculatus TaxID=7918 RepID=W5NGQ6_LEPOC